MQLRAKQLNKQPCVLGRWHDSKARPTWTIRAGSCPWLRPLPACDPPFQSDPPPGRPDHRQRSVNSDCSSCSPHETAVSCSKDGLSRPGRVSGWARASDISAGIAEGGRFERKETAGWGPWYSTSKSLKIDEKQKLIIQTNLINCILKLPPPPQWALKYSK